MPTGSLLDFGLSGGSTPLLHAARSRDWRSGGFPDIADRLPVGTHPRAAHRCPEHPPFWRCRRHPVLGRTTFFSRHGFKSWLWSKMRIVSRPTRGTSLRLTASCATNRTVQRACPSGGLLADHGDDPLPFRRLENR